MSLETSNPKEGLGAQNFIYTIKNLAYASILALPAVLLPHKNLQAAEIPPNASYEEGLKILQDAVMKENFETKAVAVYIIDEKGNKKMLGWISKEGETRQVAVKLSFVINGLQKIVQSHTKSLKEKTLHIDSFHTHPFYAVLHDIDSPGYDLNKNEAAPPSPAVDTSPFEVAMTVSFLKGIGIRNVKFTNKVTERNGIWTIKYNEKHDAFVVYRLYWDTMRLLKKTGLRRIAKMNSHEFANLLEKISQLVQNEKWALNVQESINNFRDQKPIEMPTILQALPDIGNPVFYLISDAAENLAKKYSIDDIERFTQILDGNPKEIDPKFKDLHGFFEIVQGLGMERKLVEHFILVRIYYRNVEKTRRNLDAALHGPWSSFRTKTQNKTPQEIKELMKRNIFFGIVKRALLKHQGATIDFEPFKKPLSVSEDELYQLKANYKAKP